MATVVPRTVHRTAEGTGALAIGPAGLAYWLSAALAVVAAASVVACAMLLAARGSAAAVITWLGSVAFLLYNSLMFVFATPANRLFLLYLAMLALAAWSAGAVLRQVDVAAFGALFSRQTPVRGIAVCMWVIVALNAATWLVRIIPAVAATGPLAYLRGTGMPVNVVYVQNLALWLPLLVAAAWRWQHVSTSAVPVRTTKGEGRE